jgi:hypothetical protein
MDDLYSNITVNTVPAKQIGLNGSKKISGLKDREQNKQQQFPLNKKIFTQTQARRELVRSIIVMIQFPPARKE